MRRSHRAIPRLLATHWLWQSEGSQRCRSKTTGHLQPVIALITREGHARLRAVNTVDHTAIVTLLGQVRLDGTDRRHRIWIGGRIESVIILVVVRIVIVVRIKSVIQPEPETVVKNKEPIAEEVGTARPCTSTSASGVSTTAKTTTTEPSSTAAVASCQTSVS